MNSVILGLSGGIAAYKSAVLASLLVKASYSVKTVMTENAQKFITATTFQALTSERVYTDMWTKENDKNHVALSTWADMIVLAPATANTIAKIANGIADNLLTATILDFTGPVYICPAMHENMWKNPISQKNINILKNELGMNIIGPETGSLAGGNSGKGRLSEPAEIFSHIDKFFKSQKRQ